MSEQKTTKLRKRSKIIDDLGIVVTPIKAFRGNHFAAHATGFFYLTQKPERLFLVTNKHVFIDPKKDYYPNVFIVRLHTNTSNLSQNEDFRIPLYSKGSTPQWIEHPRRDIDIALIELDKEKLKKKFVFKALSKKLFPPDDLELELGASVIVIGYPLGLSDEKHNLPIVRQASIASIYPVPFRGNPYVLIDAQLHPGMSGSPVMTKATSIIRKGGGTQILGGRTSYFLGIHSFSVGNLGLHSLWFPELVEEIVASSKRGREQVE